MIVKNRKLIKSKSKHKPLKRKTKSKSKLKKRKTNTKTKFKPKTKTKIVKRKNKSKSKKKTYKVLIKHKQQKGGMTNYYCNGLIPNIKIVPEKGFDLKTLLDKTGVGMPPDIND